MQLNGTGSTVKQKGYEMLEFKKDGNGHIYLEWEQIPGAFKRAWIQKREGEKDWADTGRYLNVCRCQSEGRPGGNPTDFPIWNDLPDEEILLAFVYSATAITGGRIQG